MAIFRFSNFAFYIFKRRSVHICTQPAADSIRKFLQTFSKDDRVDKRHRHDRYDRPAPKPVRTSGYRAPQTPPGQPSRAWGVGGCNAARKMLRSSDDSFRARQRNIASPTTRARDQTKGAHGFVARASDAMGGDGRFQSVAMRTRALDQAMRARTLGNEQRVALRRECPVFDLHFYTTSPLLCPTIGEHYARSDVA